MNVFRKSAFLAIMVVLPLSCSHEQWESVDVTPEFSFTPGVEGPAVNREGDLFAVNYQEEGTIGRVTPDGETEIYIKLPGVSVGNGIRFDTGGNMFIADYVGHTLYRVPKGTRSPEVWARDTTMNQPNDLAISPGGHIYLSDPNWSDSTGQIWMVSGRNHIQLLESNMGTTNGIEVSPDGEHLYVNESVQRTVWKYDIRDDGTLTNKTRFLVFPDYGLDGMRCDRNGNLYIARYDKGTVAMVSPTGEVVNEFRLKGKKPSNVAFGGPDGKRCYVTMADRGNIEAFDAPFAGNHYTRIHNKIK